MTFFGDLANQAIAQQLFPPKAQTSTVTSTYVDLSQALGYGCTGILSLGAVSGTGGPTLDVKFVECDTTNGTYTDITGATFAQQTTTSTDTQAPLMTTFFNRSKRYVKCVATIGGSTSPSFTMGVTLLAQKRNL